VNRSHVAEGQVIFKEGDVADCVFQVLSGTVEVLRELDGTPILLGTVGSGQFIGEMGVMEDRPRSATVRAASEVELEILTPSEFLEQISSSPQAALELIRRLSHRLREADDRIVNDERLSGQADGNQNHRGNDEARISLTNNAYLVAKTQWLQRQLQTPLELGARPFVVGRRPLPREGSPRSRLDLTLDDAVPFRLSRNHFVIERRGERYHVRDLRSTLGTIVLRRSRT